MIPRFRFVAAGAAPPPDAAALLIALFRRWSGFRHEPMPAMTRLIDGLGQDWMLVPACDSFFQLSESCLGRPLLAGPDPGPYSVPHTLAPQPFLPDEIGLLATLAQCNEVDGVQADAAIPHGLPGALCWAARAVRRALGPFVLPPPAEPTGQCPFPRAAPAADQRPPLR